jgi:hypothetical protein
VTPDAEPKSEAYHLQGWGHGERQCFVCGLLGVTDYLVIRADSHEAGESIVGMFDHGATLESDPINPNDCVVEAGACVGDHTVRLLALDKACRRDGLIFRGRVLLAMSHQGL